jgi:hypothetical protein
VVCPPPLAGRGPLGDRAGRGDLWAPRARRDLQRQLLAAGLPVPGRRRAAGRARAAGGRAERAAGLRSPAGFPGQPARGDRECGRERPRPAARAVRGRPAVARDHLCRRADRLRRGQLRREPGHPGLQLHRPGGPGRGAGPRGRGHRQLRRHARPGGPAHSPGRPVRADRHRCGGRGAAARLRQRAGRGPAHPHRAAGPGHRPRDPRDGRRGVHVPERLTHAGRDDGPRRRHRLRAVPHHPAPAAGHGRRRTGRGGRPDGVHQRTGRADRRRHRDRRHAGPVRLGDSLPAWPLPPAWPR